MASLARPDHRVDPNIVKVLSGLVFGSSRMVAIG
jgi:hypothetical protein